MSGGLPRVPLFKNWSLRQTGLRKFKRLDAKGTYCNGDAGSMTVSQTGNLPRRSNVQASIINFGPKAPDCPQPAVGARPPASLGAGVPANVAAHGHRGPAPEVAAISGALGSLEPGPLRAVDGGLPSDHAAKGGKER